MEPSGPATSLRGNVLDTWQGGKEGGEGELGRWDSRVEWESGEVSRPIGQLDEGERKGWQGGR